MNRNITGSSSGYDVSYDDPRLDGSGEEDVSLPTDATGRRIVPLESRQTALAGGGERREYSDGTAEQLDDRNNYTFTDADGTRLQINVDGSLIRDDYDGGGKLLRGRDGTFGAGQIASPILDLGTGDAVNAEAVSSLTGGGAAGLSHYSDDGSFEVRRTDGTTEYGDTDGTYRREGVDGSRLEVNADGSFLHEKADGSAVYRDADGAVTRKEINADGDATFYGPDGDIQRLNANGELITYDAETDETAWVRENTAGLVGPDGSETSVVADLDGNGLPETLIGEEIALADTELSELENPDYLTENLTQDEANAELDAIAAGNDPSVDDGALDEVLSLASTEDGGAVLVNRDGDVTLHYPDGDTVPGNEDIYRENANGQIYTRTDGETSWSSEGAFGTVNPDGVTTTIELDTDDDGVPDTLVEDAVPLGESNVEELLDPRFLESGILEGDAVSFAGSLPPLPSIIPREAEIEFAY